MVGSGASVRGPPCRPATDVRTRSWIYPISVVPTGAAVDQAGKYCAQYRLLQQNLRSAWDNRLLVRAINITKSPSC